jgi:hypothetical protein
MREWVLENAEGIECVFRPIRQKTNYMSKWVLENHYT